VIGNRSSARRRAGDPVGGRDPRKTILSRCSCREAWPLNTRSPRPPPRGNLYPLKDFSKTALRAIGQLHCEGASTSPNRAPTSTTKVFVPPRPAVEGVQGKVPSARWMRDLGLLVELSSISFAMHLVLTSTNGVSPYLTLELASSRRRSTTRLVSIRCGSTPRRTAFGHHLSSGPTKDELRRLATIGDRSRTPGSAPGTRVGRIPGPRPSRIANGTHSNPIDQESIRLYGIVSRHDNGGIVRPASNVLERAASASRPRIQQDGVEGRGGSRRQTLIDPRRYRPWASGPEGSDSTASPAIRFSGRGPFFERAPGPYQFPALAIASHLPDEPGPLPRDHPEQADTSGNRSGWDRAA